MVATDWQAHNRDKKEEQGWQAHAEKARILRPTCRSVCSVAALSAKLGRTSKQNVLVAAKDKIGHNKCSA